MTSAPSRPKRRRLCALLLGSLVASRAQATPADRFTSNFDGLSLVDQEGRPFRFARHAGRVLLVNFVYTGCSTSCAVQTHELASVQAALPVTIRDRVAFVSMSIDPLSDTPATLKTFAGRMGADLKTWSFVTGTPADVDVVAKRLRLFRSTAVASNLPDHATSLWIVDGEGRLRQRLSGIPVDRARVRDELVALVGLAS